MYRLGYTAFTGLLVAIGMVACTAWPAHGEPVWVAIANRDDRITWTIAEDNLTVDIYSPGGIGSARILLAADRDPQRVLLRFHLAGLEGLRFTSNSTVVTVSVPSTDESAVRQEVTLADGEPWAITADSPYWMEIRLIADEAPSRHAKPVTDGYVEAEIPQHFLQRPLSPFLIEWVDFYR
jgi:hypothetical protein